MRVPRGAYFILVMLVSIAACKKKEDEAHPKATGPVCKMSSVVRLSFEGCRDSVAFLGDLDKVSVMLSFKTCKSSPGRIFVNSKSFIYDGDTVRVINTTTGDQETLILQPGTMRILEIIGAGPLPAVTRYEYSANGNLLRSINSYSNRQPNDTGLYAFSNGDLTMTVRISNGRSDTTRFSYFLDKNLPESGWVTQFFQAYGNAYTIKNAHLLDAVVGGGVEARFQYETDKFGNIIKVVRSDNGSPADSTVYHYECATE